MNRAALQGPMQRNAAEVYAQFEGRTVEEVMQALGVTRNTVTRAARTYGVRFAGIDVRKQKTPQAAPPRPSTRTVVVVERANGTNTERRMQVSLPKETWLP